VHWNNYLACFFAGLFLANSVPHYIQGVSGNRFPSPFAKPPGKGLSTPLTNTLWGLLNIVVGYLLFRAGNVATGGNVALAIFFAGIVMISVMSSLNFAKKHTS